MEGLSTIISAAQIAATISLLAGKFTTFGQAKVASSAIESMARQPEATED